MIAGHSITRSLYRRPLRPALSARDPEQAVGKILGLGRPPFAHPRNEAGGRLDASARILEGPDQMMCAFPRRQTFVAQRIPGDGSDSFGRRRRTLPAPERAHQRHESPSTLTFRAWQESRLIRSPLGEPWFRTRCDTSACPGLSHRARRSRTHRARVDHLECSTDRHSAAGASSDPRYREKTAIPGRSPPEPSRRARYCRLLKLDERRGQLGRQGP